MNTNLSVFKRDAYRNNMHYYSSRYRSNRIRIYAPSINTSISYYKVYKEPLRIYEADYDINGGGYYWSTAFSLPKHTIKCAYNTIRDYSMLSFRCINKIKATIHILRNL